MSQVRLYLLLSLICLLFACAAKQQGIQGCMTKKWAYKQHSQPSHVTLDIRRKDADNIRAFMALYRVTNYQSQFNTLRFQKVLWDEAKQSRVYFFEVRDSGDVQAIFTLDKDDNLIDNFLVSSERQLFRPSMLKPWQYKKGFYASYTTESALKNDTKLVKSLIELYRLNSENPYFNQLTFDKVLLNEKKQGRAFLFYVQSVSDTQAVFELDNNNNLIDNFMTSLWDR
ncbi:MAG: hypothetical protein ACI8WB_004580 [Phenylobacterium sp.]|jgi:hypothetical protein